MPHTEVTSLSFCRIERDVTLEQKHLQIFFTHTTSSFRPAAEQETPITVQNDPVDRVTSP